MLTGKQLKIIRQIAGFTGTEVADKMLVTKQTISSIETGKTETPSSIRYYEMSLKDMIEDLVDPDLHRICLDLLRAFEDKNEHSSEWLLLYKKPEGVSLTIEGEFRTLAEAESMAYEMKNVYPYAEYYILKDRNI